MGKVASLVTGHITTVGVAVVVLTVLSLVPSRVIGKHEERKRRTVVKLTFYGGLILFSLYALPQLMGARV